MNSLQIDWLKLDGFNKKISANILKRLPKDWNLSFDDIQSEVNETFVKLIKLYVPMVNGWSLTTYCYQYAEKITYDRLMKEYNRLKKQVSITDAFIEKYDRENYMRHQYSYYSFEPYTTIDKDIETKDIIDRLLKIGDDIDRSIVSLIIINDMTQKQIAKILHISQSTISKRLKKYAKLLK